ncbi:MAG: tetratricopeptide repeat protein [Ignavibacteriae bacterium]|nr:tetratricopeptide repeat protein [Ignavibacteriota bacterium]
MLKAQKRISKREMKQDALVSSIAKATQFFDLYKKNIGLIVGAVVVLIIATAAFISNRRTQNEEASAKLGSVYSYYDNNQFQIAIDGIPERKITGLKSIVDQYGSTDAGNFAQFYLANAYYHLGKYDEALNNFEDFSASEPYLVISRLTGIASCYEIKGEYEKAAEQYEKAALSYPKDIDAAANLNDAANNFMLAGNNERALELFKKLKKEYPTTQYARDADRYITRLEA